MRLIPKLTIVVVIAALLFGCGNVSEHVVKEGDKYYLLIPEVEQPNRIDDSVHLIITDVFCDSMEQLLQKIYDCDFTEEELQTIDEYFEKDDKGRVILFDLKNINAVLAPKEYEKSKTVWFSTYYYYCITSAEASGLILVYPCWTQEKYDKGVEKFQNYAQEFSPTIVQIAERNATMYSYTNVRKKPAHSLYYVIETDHKTMHVMEDYVEGVLTHIWIYGVHNGEYFYANISGLDERPSVEWLSEFGLTEYKG